MSIKKPLCQYSGNIEELHSGDSIFDDEWNYYVPSSYRAGIEYSDGNGAVWGDVDGATITGGTSGNTADIIGASGTNSGKIDLDEVSGDFIVGETLTVTGSNKNGDTLTVDDYNTDMVWFGYDETEKAFLSGTSKVFLDTHDDSFGRYTFFMDDDSDNFDLVSTHWSPFLRIIKSYAGDYDSDNIMQLGWQGVQAKLYVAGNNILQSQGTKIKFNSSNNDIDFFIENQTGFAYDYNCGDDHHAWGDPPVKRGEFHFYKGTDDAVMYLESGQDDARLHFINSDGDEMAIRCNSATGTNTGEVRWNDTTVLEFTDTTFAIFGATPQSQQAHIADADGTLADITTKFNTLLADLEGYGLLATS